jgi:hypothetical protein
VVLSHSSILHLFACIRQHASAHVSKRQHA